MCESYVTARYVYECLRTPGSAYSSGPVARGQLVRDSCHLQHYYGGCHKASEFPELSQLFHWGCLLLSALFPHEFFNRELVSLRVGQESWVFASLRSTRFYCENFERF